MRIPPLFSKRNLRAPPWVELRGHEIEHGRLWRAIVNFVGFDPNTGQVQQLGSGFIIEVGTSLTVLTASHVITWWADHVTPPKKGIPGGGPDLQDLERRIDKLVELDYIRCIVRPVGTGSALCCKIAARSLALPPNKVDVACVALRLPEGVEPKRFLALPMDADDFLLSEPVIMAGFGAGVVHCQGPDRFQNAICALSMHARAGRVGELIAIPERSQCPMFRVNIPSEAGMSGGPLLIRRPIHKQQGMRGPAMITAVGIISKSRMGTPFLLNHNLDGETDVIPIWMALRLSAACLGRPDITLAEAAKANLLETYGKMAKRIEFVENKETGKWNVRFPSCTMATKPRIR